MTPILRGRFVAVLAMAAAAVPIAAPVATAKPSKASPARTNLVKAVKTADTQAKKLIKRSASCPAAAKQRGITTKVRAAQTKRLAKASPSALRLKQVRISVHTRRLAVALTKCDGSSSTNPGGPRQLTITPGSGGSGGTGAPGSPGADGVAGSSLPLDSLGDTLDASGLLGTGILPGVIPVVDTGALGSDPVCAVSGAVCVGVDRAALTSALTDAVTDRVAQFPALAPVLQPLLAQVTSALASNNPNALINVTRTGDKTLVVTAKPNTALASLANLLDNSGGLPLGVSVGDIQVRL